MQQWKSTPSSPTAKETTTPDNPLTIRIRRNGAWEYQGSPIKRLDLCRLFSSILHLDAKGDYWLITPVERERVAVDLTPFFITNFSWQQGVLRLCTSLGEWVSLDSSHPVFMRTLKSEPSPLPFIRVRDNLEGLLSRSVFYGILERAQEETGNIVLTSGQYKCVL